MTPEDGRARGGVLQAIIRRLAAAGALGSAAMVGALVLYRPWGWRLRVPVSTAFDTQLNAIFIKNVLTGTVYSTERLGAPFGQHLQDFPVGGDRWSYLIVRAIGTMSDDPFVVLNIFYIVGFGLIAACTYLVARELRLAVTTSSVVALLAAFLPYHFWRGEMHVWLANYAGQPLMVLLAVWVVRDELRVPLVHRHLGSWTRQQRRRGLIAAASIVVLGGNGGYYAVFAMLTVAAAGVLAQVHRRSWRNLVTGVVTAAGVGVVLALNLIPELIWRVRHGVDDQVAHRLLIENDQYALRLVKLVLPGADHRLAPFAHLGDQTVLGEGGEYAGLIAVAGLLAGWVLLFSRGLRPRVDDAPTGAPDRSLPLALAAVSTFLVVLGTAGGLGYLIAIVGTTQFRAWSRVALPLALCGLFAAGWWVDRFLPRLDRRRFAATAGAVGVLVVGLLDQIPADVAPAEASTRAALEATRAFVTHMEQNLPAEAMVFQLPVVGFPEHGPVGDLPDYALALPYLVGDDQLRWSYGGIRGREADWQVWWNQQPLATEVAGIAAAGFDALSIDRRAYPADDAAALMEDLTELVGPPRGASTDDRLVWFDLRPLQDRLTAATSPALVQRAGELILHGVTATYHGDVSPNLDPRGAQQRLVGPSAEIEFSNPMDEARTIRVRSTWTSQTGATLVIGPPGELQRVELGTGPTEVVLAVQVPAGGSATVGVDLDGRGQPHGDVTFPVVAELRSMAFDEAEVRAVVEAVAPTD